MLLAMAAFEIPEGIKLDKAYEVYSQEFRREDLDQARNYNNYLSPSRPLTNKNASSPNWMPSCPVSTR